MVHLRFLGVAVDVVVTEEQDSTEQSEIEGSLSKC
jgi:hypothetical protein